MDRAPRLTELSEEQQQLAMRLGSGYRVIKGVAGSGKTVVLVARVRLLASENPEMHFGIFCFNNALSKMLTRRLSGLANITVATIDSFASRECSARKLKITATGSERFEQQAEIALQSATSTGGTTIQFDAVFVDEAQDLDAKRLGLAFASLKDPDGDFVISYDTAQLTKPSSEVTRWTPPGGRTARGRTKLMRINYRNTQEVLQHAYYFLRRGESVVDNNCLLYTSPSPRD